MAYLGQIKATLLAISIGVGVSVQSLPDNAQQSPLVISSPCLHCLTVIHGHIRQHGPKDIVWVTTIRVTSG